MTTEPNPSKKISIPRVLSYAGLWLLVIGGFAFMLVYRLINEHPVLAAVMGALIIAVPIVYFVMSRRRA